MPASIPETARAAIARAAVQIESETPRLDAELLMAHALGVTRERLLLAHLDDATPPAFAPLLARRLAHEPIAYITASRAFWTIELTVGPGALVPRADSETLLEAAVAPFGKEAPARILDLGTGPGTLLLAALDQWPDAIGLGIDASEEALAYARANAKRLGKEGRATLQTGDWAGGVTGPFDLILANPPYIATDASLPGEVRAHEPASALFAGADGLNAYRVLAPQIAPLLAPGGIAAIEIGHTQAEAVSALFAAPGLSVTVARDLGSRDRAIVLTWVN
ncbi:peptide chain release factor N(5)-glutamine methyltransferase [soil metagenome]